jgi:putative thioredoxin
VGFSEHILDVDESTFESEVLLRSHEMPVLVDFWAEWCGPCRVLSPLLERLAVEGGGAFRLAKVNVDQNPRLTTRYGIQGIPAVKGFRNGQVVAEFVGAQPEAMVRRFVEKLAPSAASLALEKARSLLATRHWSEAEQAFREILAEDEGNAGAALGLVKSLLMQGRGREALQLIERFPAGVESVEAQKLLPLAQLLEMAGAEGQESPPDDPLAARLVQSARLIALGNLPAAMDGLLDILREDKTYRKGLPRQILLALFMLLGDEDPLTRQYRDELASVLF